MKLDALVLLGCRVEGPDQLSPPARRRVERAAAAYRELAPGLVIASGGRRWQGVLEADALARALVGLGVPESAIELERESLSTRENARFSSRILRERSLTDVGVVTCDWHLERALRCFRREGVLANGIAAASPPLPPLATALRGLRERGSALLENGIAAALTRAWRSS